MKMRNAARLLAVPAAAGLITLGLAGPASAHVTVTPENTAAGSFTVVTMSVPHGCDGSPTTKVAIQIPEDILAVTPTRNPYYDVAKKIEKLPEPVTDAHGNEVTERVASVEYTAKTPLPDGERDAFELSLQLPEKAGETLAFPAVQTCEKGETAWTEVPAGRPGRGGAGAPGSRLRDHRGCRRRAPRIDAARLRVGRGLGLGR